MQILEHTVNIIAATKASEGDAGRQVLKIYHNNAFIHVYMNAHFCQR